MFTKAKLFHAAGEGSGGGDQHNLGWYATESALTTAHPTATDGDWAIVGTTDTVWTWDSDTTAWVDTGAAGIELPDQTGNSGKFLTTDGTSPSWSDKPLVNRATGTDALAIGNSNTTASTASSVVVGYGAHTNGGSGSAVAIGNNASVYSSCVSIGSGSAASNYGAIAIGPSSYASATRSIQIGYGSNTEAGTLSIGLYHNSQFPNYKLLDSDGTIPTARLTNAINKYSSMPTAGADYLGQIAQFTGTTDATYTHGYIYECVSDGGNPATYSWTAVSVQAGGSSLPSQTGNAGKFLTTDGTDASWGDALANNTTNANSVAILGTTYNSSCTKSVTIGAGAVVYNYDTVTIGYNSYANGYQGIAIGSGATSLRSGGIAIGYSARAGDNNSVVIGNNASAGDANCSSSVAIGPDTGISGDFAIAIGTGAKAYSARAIQLGPGTNSDTGTLKVAVSSGKYSTPVNYELMSVDGTIPTARLTKVNSTITLAAADWSGGSQTVTVTGMTATGVVLVSPDPTDQSAYTGTGILCTAQGSGTLTFTCTSVPSGDIDVNVVML